MPIGRRTNQNKVVNLSAFVDSLMGECESLDAIQVERLYQHQPISLVLISAALLINVKADTCNDQSMFGSVPFPSSRTFLDPGDICSVVGNGISSNRCFSISFGNPLGSVK